MRAITHLTLSADKFKDYLEKADIDEKQRRLLYGFLASNIGYGGVTAIARALSVSSKTVRRGLSEYEENNAVADEDAQASPRRIRKAGGGRKRLTAKQPGLAEALLKILERNTYGDPMRVLCWTTLSLRKIQEELAAQGFKISHTVVGEQLTALGYSKQVNQKMLQVNEPHPDRDAQFRFINQKSEEFIAANLPLISIDCKKKENIGNFKNNGQEYRESGCPRPVLDHDFEIKQLGKVAPFGIYVVNDNTAFVNLGTSSDTAEFAAESVNRWWHYIGSQNFPGAKKLFITCDGGGSNGYRVRLWKWMLAHMAERYELEIHVSHLPPGTSKWNKIEHRLFCYISKNWAGQPLVDIETAINLISNTKTKGGLKVSCKLDENVYQRGIKIEDEEFERIDIERIGDFGQWNYIIRGFKSN